MEPGRKASALLFFCIIAWTCNAQLQPVHIFQKDDTLLKKNYYEQSLKIKNSLLASAGKEHFADYKKIYDEQFDEIFDLLGTTRSVTAPDAHGYLQSILQKIISANSELKSLDVRVIFSRDWWPNAFSMGDGTITINAGLMVYLDNEAELAFVLCHELSHYYLDHTAIAIKKYIEKLNSAELQKELKRISKEEFRVNQQVEKLAISLVFDSRLHSRINEAEADLQAFNFMKKTGYDCNAIKTSLQLLDKIDDSLLFKPLDLQRVFNFPDYSFKQKWIQKESSIFSQLKEDDSPLTQKEKDSLKTHPDCGRRILLLSDSLQKLNSAGEKFLVDENVFYKLKKDFFIEMAEQCYINNDLSRNMYYSLLFLQSNDNDAWAVYTVSRCLNLIYEKQKKHQLGLSIETENRKYPNDYNSLLRMLSRLRLDEIINLNFYFCKQYYEIMRGYSGFSDEVKKMLEQRKQVTN